MNVEFYKRPDETEPAKEFIDSLDLKMQAKLAMEIQLLEDFGVQLRLPYSEHLEDGIFELRAKVSTNISRVLYFFYVGNTAILTNGFMKKSQQTPREEIEKAKRYREDYLKRKERS